MKENEIEKIKETEKNNTDNMSENNEKVHYEIKFVETEDGYRLEATGDKAALKRLGIGPNMVGRGRKHGRGRAKGPRGRRGHGPRWARRGPGSRAAMMGQRRRAVAQPEQSSEFEQPRHEAGFGWDW